MYLIAMVFTFLTLSLLSAFSPIIPLLFLAVGAFAVIKAFISFIFS